MEPEEQGPSSTHKIGKETEIKNATSVNHQNTNSDGGKVPHDDWQNGILQSGDKMTALLEQNELILSKLDDIYKSLEDSTEKGRLIESLFRKNKEYEEDFFFNKIIKRLFLDVIKVFERVDRIYLGELDAYHQETETSKKFLSLRREMLQLLRRNDIELKDTTGAAFDESICEAIDIKAVDTPEDDMKIVEVISPAFYYLNKLLKPAMVVVGKYTSNSKEYRHE